MTAQPAPLTRPERAAVAGAALLALGLGVIGMVNSFARVNEAVQPSFGGLAWTVPLGIDLGIAAFAALDLVLARMGMRVLWLRLVPWALAFATIYLNVADEATGIGWVGHAALPLLWVATVEVGCHVVRDRLGLIHHRGRAMDRVRSSRWLLSPVTTLRLWRRMVLWEVTDYNVALRLEKDRLLARCELVDEYGRLRWRWRAPRQKRLAQRLVGRMPVARDVKGDTGSVKITKPVTPRATPVGAGSDTKRSLVAVAADPEGDAIDAIVAQYAEIGVTATGPQIVKKLAADYGINIGVRTVQRRLAERTG